MLAEISESSCVITFEHPTTKKSMTFKSYPENVSPWAEFNIEKLV